MDTEPYFTKPLSDYYKILNKPVSDEPSETVNPTDTEVADDDNTKQKKGNGRDFSKYLRYAPIFGAGVQYLSDLFGATNADDYSGAEMFQRSFNNIPAINYTPLTNYMSSSPIDEEYQRNIARSQYNALARAAIENSNGNAGAALAAINSIGRNLSDTFGDIAVQSAKYNDEQRKAVAQYNANIARINSSLSMTAQEKNQAVAAQKAELTYKLAKMIEDERNLKDTMRTANASSFFE